jgi:hypothetical protein
MQLSRSDRRHFCLIDRGMQHARVKITGPGVQAMSRAFVREDAGDYVPPGRFGLPPRDDPRFDAAAARALIEAARDANTASAEAATGYRWGEDRLRPHVRRLLAEAEALPEEEQDRRYIRVARRFLGQG